MAVAIAFCVSFDGVSVSLVLRCPKCQGRYQPAGSLEAGDLDTRCPHCARKKQKRAARARPVVDIPAEAGGTAGSNVIWLGAVLAGAAVLVPIMGAVLLGGAAPPNARPASPHPG